MAILTVIWEKWVEFKHEWVKITISSLISPLLYLLTFGLGIGTFITTGDRPYLQFLIPGIIALTTMNSSFNAVGMSLNVQRLYEHSFDSIMASPTPLWQYVIGQMIGGSLRGMYAGVLILIISLFFSVQLCFSICFFGIMLLNGMLFGALGVMAAIVSSTHADIARFSTFVILPMTFLCNTFFSVEQIPKVLQWLIEVLPLTHTSRLLRQLAWGESVSWVSILILIAYTALFMLIALFKIQKAKNL